MNKLTPGAACAALWLSFSLTPLPAYAEQPLILAPTIVEAPLISSPASSSHDVNGDNSLAIPYSDGADYLRTLPGITAGRFGGHGLELSIRGQSEGRLNVVSGDVYTFGGCPNRMDPPTAYINFSAYDKVTVVRGYQSVLNGFGGPGGSIIVEPGLPDFGDQLDYEGLLSGGYDSNSEMWHTNNNITAGTDQVYVKAYGSYKDAENYEDGDGNEVRSSFDEKSGGMTFGFTPGTSHLYAGFDFHRIEDALFPGAGMDSPLSDGRTFKAGLEYDVGGAIVEYFEVSGYASLVDHEMDNFNLRPFVAMMPLRVDSESDTYGVKLKSDLMLGQRRVESALEWRRNNRDAARINNNTNLLQSLLWPDITIDEIGLAAETTYELGRETRLVVGGRYDYVHVDYGRANEAAPAAGNRTPNDIYSQFYGVTASSETEHNLGGLLRVEYDYTPSTLFYVGLSRSVRTADATERGLANFIGVGGANSWVGNPKIKPENHHQMDAGFEVEKPAWAFSGSVYADLVEDYILRDSARSQPGTRVNFPNADIYRNVDVLLAGLELRGQWQLAPAWSLQGDATYTFGEDLDGERALAQIPPLQGKLGVTWQASDALELSATMRWALKQTRVDTNPTTGTGRDVDETDGYAVFDLAGRLTEFEPISLSFGVTNIFDETYASHLNRSNISDPTEIQVNEPGRSFYVQLALPF